MKVKLQDVCKRIYAGGDVPKDRFSSLVYGLYYIRQQEERNKKRKSRNISDLLFFGH